MSADKINSQRMPLSLLTGLVSLLGIFPAFTWLLGNFKGLFYPKFPESIFYFMEPFFFPEKRLEIFSYMFAVIIGTLSTCVLLLYRKLEVEQLWWKAIQESPRNTTILASIGLTCNFLCWNIPGLLGFLCWFVTVIFSYIPILAAINRYINARPWISFIPLTTSIVAFALVIVPLLFTPPRISSEYLDVEGTTLISSDGILPPHEVDNHNYINSNAKFGFVKYDYRRTASPEVQQLLYPNVKITSTPELLSLVKVERNSFSPEISDAFHDMTQTKFSLAEHRDFASQRITYDETHSILYSLMPFDEKFESLLESSVLDAEKYRIRDLNKMSEAIAANKHRSEYDQEDRNFLSYNQMEIENQIYSRAIIHHHNFMLGAINEIDLNRPINQINMQYGFLFATLSQNYLKHIFGGIYYDNYYHFLYSLYPAYFLLSFFIFWKISRDLHLTIIFWTASVGSFLLMGYTALVVAPGINPVRHFFDLLTLYVLYLSLTETISMKKLLFELILYGLLLISALTNKETGLALSAAVFFPLFINQLISRSGIGRIPIVHLIAFLLIVITSFNINSGTNALSSYYLLGLCGFPTHEWYNLPFLATMVFVLFTIINFWSAFSPAQKYLLLAGLLYSIGLYIYYIWGGTRHHFLNYLNVYLFVLILSLKWACKCVINGNRIRHISFQGVTLVMTFLYFSLGSAIFLREKLTFDHDFLTHKTYDWKSRKAKIISTMPEEPFIQSEDLIKRCTDDPGIFIISQYDNFIPFLSGRYSAMPYPDLQWFINGERERKECINQINNKKPKFIFTDRDILRDYSFETIDQSTPIIGKYQIESIMRIHRLIGLQSIFKDVSKNYRLLESSGLISAWIRRED